GPTTTGAVEAFCRPLWAGAPVGQHRGRRLLDRRPDGRQALADLGSVPLEPIARELAPEVPRRPAELRPEASREDLGRGGAAGEGNLWEGASEVEEEVACRLEPDSEIVAQGRIVDPPTDQALELPHREAIRRG